MFNLNGEEFKSQTVAIFNNGEAGKVDNVNINVAKKTVEDPDNAPSDGPNMVPLSEIKYLLKQLVSIDTLIKN